MVSCVEVCILFEFNIKRVVELVNSFKKMVVD